MCATAALGDALRMTKNNGSRRLWVGAAVAVLATGMIGRALVQSGTVTGGPLTHWYGQVALGAAAFAVAGAALYLLDRAYRRN